MPENLIGSAKVLHVSLFWEGSPTATQFRVFRRLDSETNFTEIGQTVIHQFANDMPDGTLYADYYVVAENGFGLSPDSASVTVQSSLRRR